ncbi:hypothetical protein [Psychrobacter sp. FME5]|uniref:hypothetical protein n=1 Tax=Psychrobacter sp. FME5 TaxID=2487706 RepID=UPI00178814BA|nr:hypothetical protein [Psychrobacter sp. FME5]MBE0445122.1 hypothetical protein [Psychrobacter sp. FME5]
MASQEFYPSIAEECNLSEGQDSPQCKIMAMDDLTQNEKHRLLGYIYWTGVEADYAKAKR